MNNSFKEMIYKITHELAIKVINEKELIIAEWLELNKKRITDITLEKYSFKDLKKKLEEYMILKKKNTPIKLRIVKINDKGYLIDRYHCPNCNKILGCEGMYEKDKHKYCFYCGQALDWSDIHE